MAKKRLSVIIGAIDKLSKPMQKINGRIEKIKAPIDKVNRAMNKMGRQAGLKQFNRDLKRSAKSMANAGRAFAGAAKWATGLSLAAGGAIAGLATNFASAGDNIGKASLRLNLGAEALQEMRYAADRSGVSASTFDMAVQRYGRRAAEASMGTGAAKDAIKALGLELEGSGGKMKNTETLMMEALDALGRVQDPMKRNALAMKLFDSEGVKLVQMAAAGADGIKKMRQEARELGLVMSEKSVKASEDFTDKMTNMSAVVSGLRNRIGSKLIPVLIPLIQKFATIALKLGPKLSTWAQGFANALPGRVARLSVIFNSFRSGLSGVTVEGQELDDSFQSLGERFSGILKIVSWVSENFGIMNTVMAVMGAVIASKLIIGVVALAGAVKALGFAIMMTPIGWIVAGIAAVVAAGVLLYKNWDTVKNAIISFGKMALLNNPFALLIKGADRLVKMLTGFSVIESLKSRLSNMLPDWAIDLLDLESSSAKPVSAPIPNAQAQVGGTVHVTIDSEGRPRVNSITADNAAVGIAVDAGMAMGGPVVHMN
ncbi:hypothetical protein [Aliamphritea ceti]|uniref:hypothetical protein n=1 Tax=Aliamphritea ceti TaxID=1524258 RepID=UPI0021C36181|nr:hypothetical protein [Aliamphritea ceti]